MSWGEPGLSPAERVIAWNALDVLAIKAANSDAPINAIPAAANAVCGFRFVVGTDVANLARHLRVHFDAYGFDDVQVAVGGCCPATRLDLDNPWVKWALESLAATTGKRPAPLPNLGGTIPNDVFSETLKLPTLWVPRSYPACSQHAPDEHLLGSVVREALAVMAGLWWDLGVGTTKPVRYPATN
jgi:acetylornithine deacetylase/succinyl-diaminopimelate desuccinylase-like protein